MRQLPGREQLGTDAEIAALELLLKMEKSALLHITGEVTKHHCAIGQPSASWKHMRQRMHFHCYEKIIQNIVGNEPNYDDWLALSVEKSAPWILC